MDKRKARGDGLREGVGQGLTYLPLNAGGLAAWVRPPKRRWAIVLVNK